MSRLKPAITRLANAQRRFNDAFDELREATHAYTEAVKQEQDESWKQITSATKDKVRRPKGEIEELVTNIFQNGTPGPLSFAQIFEAIVRKSLVKPSPSTVRQTLYRMRRKQTLECYGGRWSKGVRMKIPA